MTPFTETVAAAPSKVKSICETNTSEFDFAVLNWELAAPSPEPEFLATFTAIIRLDSEDPDIHKAWADAIDKQVRAAY